MPQVLPPVIAILGVIASAFVIRTRYRARHSLYTSVRKNRTRQIEEARRRALVTGPTAAVAAAEPGRGENVLETVFGLISLAAALGLVLMGVILAVGARD